MVDFTYPSTRENVARLSTHNRSTRVQARIKTLGGPMPKDRGGPDQGIFQDLWRGGVSEGLGVTTFSFLPPQKGGK
jgi:hypothetical protein